MENSSCKKDSKYSNIAIMETSKKTFAIVLQHFISVVLFIFILYCLSLWRPHFGLQEK